MKCPYCGNKVGKNDMFCDKCGKKIGVSSHKRKSINSTPIIILIITGVLLVASVVVLIMVIRDNSITSVDDRNMQNEYDSEDVTDDTKTFEEDEVIKSFEFKDDELMINAEEYYSANAEILSVTKVDDAEEILTSSEAISGFEERGFSLYEVTSFYEINGDMYSDGKIVGKTNEKHPCYQTYYMNSSDELWTLFIINNKVLANPVSFNMQSERNAQLIISEDESIVSYDSVTNSYYETIPDESELIVLKVDKIDSNTLDRYTITEIDEHIP